MVKIITLGDFDITIGDISIIDKIGSSQKIIKLFKYFLVNENIKLLPEKIMDDLWLDEDFKNPTNMLRTQISRLRNILCVNNICQNPFFSINYINGYYIFTLEERVRIDFVEFESLLQQDFTSLKKSIHKDPDNFSKIISSYKGDFLGELGEEDWIVPIRSKYDRLYLKGLCYHIDYLKENSMYNEIINICEEAISVKPYEEIVHISLMEALVELEQNSYALIHYEFFTKKLFNDFSIAPSKKLKETYKMIKSKEEKKSSSSIDLNKIDGEMKKEFDFGGVIYCEIEHFKYIYNYEKRNKDRNEDRSKGTGIGIISLYSKGYEQLTKEEIKKGMYQLGYTFFKVLRRGDMVAQWNDNQMIIMLYGLRQEHIKVVVDRINDRFEADKLDENLCLNIKLNIL